MPELPEPKARPHPWTVRGANGAVTRRAAVDYAELQVTSNFTFLTGASHPDEFARQAAELGHRAIAITDHATLAGVVRAHIAAKDAGLPLILGTRLDLTAPQGVSLLLYATDRASYGRLCRLLTLGRRRAEKGSCHLDLHDVIDHQEGLLAAVLPPRVCDEPFMETVRGLRDVFDDDRFSIVASAPYGPNDRDRLWQCATLAEHLGAPLLATNDVHYHVSERRQLQDVLTCIRHVCTLDEAGHRLLANAERHLKPPEEMARLFAEHPRAIRRTIEIAERCADFTLDDLRYEYPDEIVPSRMTAQSHLIDLTWRGAAWRYPDGVPESVRKQIQHELQLIEELDYAPYFLTCHDLVSFARSRGILCQGRGAAANSAVCFCLGVTSVDPGRINLLFERFISKERNEPPDIDIDFEHERREEVIQYIYEKYGRDRAALTAVVISYRGRSAIRDVGKACGLSLDCVDRLAKSLDWWDHGIANPDRLRELGVNPNDTTIQRVIELANELLGFPRHLSQHVGGFVITRGPLSELVPIENAAMEDRTVIEWDKDDIDALGILKVDVLGLGMLTCIRKCLELLDEHYDRPLNLATIPAEDPSVYDMICEADTIGVFQIESRAQMAMSPRLKPRCYYDLVIEVAIVRPGPIQGGMVHPYLRRRAGLENAEYPSPEIERVLGKTLGVPLFQEQAMALAVVAAGFTPGEADRLRRAMAAWKRNGDAIFGFQDKLINGMIERGFERDFAERCFEQIKGFSGYGFPESHAASFALLVYASAWQKKHYPAAFATALINSLPMGFYAPAQIVRDAQEHGVEVRPVDVNQSEWDCTLEEGERGKAMRLGMRMVKGLREDEAHVIAAVARERGGFRTVEGLHRNAGVRVAALKQLARADAFSSMDLSRQQALWEVRALKDDALPLFDEAGLQEEVVEAPAPLPRLSEVREVSLDYGHVGLSLKAHPVSFLRDRLDAMGVMSNAALLDEGLAPQGRWVKVAGVVLVRQRPGTASGIVFITMEDETGIANLIVRPQVYQRYRASARHSVVILARGMVERQGSVVHVQTHSIESLDGVMRGLRATSRDFH